MCECVALRRFIGHKAQACVRADSRNLMWRATATFNDVSDVAFQELIRAANGQGQVPAEQFLPIGPYLVTR